MELRRTLKVETDFVKTTPRGTITLTYTCLPDLVRVNVDLTGLNREGCKQILLLNEQGATFFRKYSTLRLDAFGSEHRCMGYG